MHLKPPIFVHRNICEINRWHSSFLFGSYNNGTSPKEVLHSLSRTNVLKLGKIKAPPCGTSTLPSQHWAGQHSEGEWPVRFEEGHTSHSKSSEQKPVNTEPEAYPAVGRRPPREEKFPEILECTGRRASPTLDSASCTTQGGGSQNDTQRPSKTRICLLLMPKGLS